MILDFYKTGFDVTKNGVYENLGSYLTASGLDYETEYKYIEPALNVTIKLPVDSHAFTKKWDYCVAYDKDSGKAYYYYVMNCKWKGRETLELSLGLDTLNTFWKEISSSWTPETHITRRFKDRWFKSRTKACPKIDRKEEDFGTVPMRRLSVSAINPSASTKKWTLVYMTEYTSDDNLKNNPISVYAYPSSPTPVATGTSGSVEWGNSMFDSDRAFAVSWSDNPDFSVTVDGTNVTVGNGSVWIVWSQTYKKYYVKRFIKIYADGTVVANQHEAESITFSSCKSVYEQDFDYADSLDVSSSASKNWPMEGKMDYSKPIQINAGEAYSSLSSFSDWYALHKTDARLVKIRELPYAPFKETYKDNQLVLPSGWEISNVGLKFTGTAFGSYFLGTRSATFTTLATTDIVDTAPDIKYETKLYNSAYYGDKLVYDSNTWVAKWETYNSGTGKIISGMADLGVNYAVSDGIDNGSLFQVIQDFEYDTDFGDYIVVDKNTDKPYFTNDYLNYIRFGKSVDEKSANWNVGSAVVGGMGSILTSVSSAAFAGNAIAGATAAGGLGGGGVGALVGLAVGTVVTAISVAKTCSTAYDTLNSKIDAYTHQASSVSGTSDVSLFNIYSGNKLLSIIYEPVDEIKQMLWNYFRLYGYADDSYEIPTFTRRYVDYFKLEPVFTGDLLWNDFLDDIKQRMSLGFRVFHYVDDGYDLLFSKENWETSIWEWAHS